jgi:hypothetical protein
MRIASGVSSLDALSTTIVSNAGATPRSASSARSARSVSHQLS